MKITVLGLGHVGLVAAAGLAVAGHQILATDIDRKRLNDLKGGKLPFYEPGLADWVTCALQEGHLRFLHTSEFDGNLGEVALVTVGTSIYHESHSDLTEVWSSISWIKSMSTRDLVVVMKSTVPPGTGMAIIQRELNDTGIGYAANPEFLREGQAVNDWTFPDRIVIGSAGGDHRPIAAVSRMYAGSSAPVLATDVTSAEMIKYASNAFLATRISFINEISALCDNLGASIDDVSEGLALDSRMGSRIHAGVGYGGYCLPKDTRALEVIAQESGLNSELLRAVSNSNNRQRLLPIRALHERFGGSLDGVRVCVLGLAYKPGTDDVRDAPALDLLRALHKEGAEIATFDPKAMDSTRCQLPDIPVRYADSMAEASSQAQSLVLMTEWPEIVDSDWSIIAQRMETPRFVFDGRNSLNPVEMRKLGFEYAGVGRPFASGPEHSGSEVDSHNG